MSEPASPTELAADLPTFTQVPSTRSYVHSGGCGGATAIGDWAFPAICDPVRRVTATMCASCKQYRPVSEFQWADTGENIQAYRNRLFHALPPAYKSKRRLRALAPVLAFLIPVAILATISGVWEYAPLVGLGLGAVGVVVALVVVPKAPKINFCRYV